MNIKTAGIYLPQAQGGRGGERRKEITDLSLKPSASLFHNINKKHINMMSKVK